MPEEKHLPILLEALALAAEKHRFQRRGGYDKLPYINHLIKVTRTINELVKDADSDTLLAAALHDIIEDTDVTEAHLARRFNPRLAAVVAELSDDMTLSDAERKRLQLEGAPHLSRPARIIRIADKGCNLLDIMQYPVDWSREKKQKYLTHALKIAELIGDIPPTLDAWFRGVARQAWTAFDMPGEPPQDGNAAD